MRGANILVDSDILVGLFKVDDSHFTRVKKDLLRLKSQDAKLHISNFVFSESLTVISQKVSHQRAKEFIYFIKEQEKAELAIIRLDEVIEELAIDIFKKQTSKNVSFVDCTNMALLEKVIVDEIWSFDEIYKKNKYKAVF